MIGIPMNFFFFFFFLKNVSMQHQKSIFPGRACALLNLLE